MNTTRLPHNKRFGFLYELNFFVFLLKPFYILRYVHISYITFVDSGESVNALFTSKNLEEGECEKDKNVLNCKMLKILQ